MTFPEVHLAGEAVVAFVDGELGSVAHARALAHLDGCAECRRAVATQREASRLLAGAPDPVLPAGLVGRLREIPMTTELGRPDVVLAVEGDDLVWSTASSLRARQGHEPGHGRSRPDPGTQRRDRRPASYPSARRPGPTRRARRALAGAVAGLAFGVCVAAASTSVYAHTGSPDQNLVHDVNGGVIRPPVTGDVTGVSNLRTHPDRTGLDPRHGGDGGTAAGRDDPQRSSRREAPRFGENTLVDPSSALTGAGGRAESVSGVGMR